MAVEKVSKIKVRRARLTDQPEIERLLEMGWHESPLALPAVSREKAAHEVREVIESGLTLVAERDGGLVAVFGLRYGEVWWSDVRLLLDVFFYVEPRARRSRLARVMIDQVRRVSRETATPAILGISFSGDVERKDVLYGRAGLKRAGGLYVEGM